MDEYYDAVSWNGSIGKIKGDIDGRKTHASHAHTYKLHTLFESYVLIKFD